MTSILAATATLAHADGNWVSAPTMQQARTGHGTTTGPCPTAVEGLGSGDCVYVLGGHPLEAALSAHVYSPQTGAWAALPSMTVGRSGLAAVTARCPDGVEGLQGACVYALGGTNGGGPQNTVEAYSPATNTWATLPSMHTARGFIGSAAAACPEAVPTLTGTCLYVAGGSTPEQPASPPDTGTPPAPDTSEPADPAAPHTQPGHAQGGHGQNGKPGKNDTRAATEVTDTVEAYSPATNTWAALPRLSAPRRSLGMAAASCPQVTRAAVPPTATCVYAVGGSGTGEPVDTVEVYDPRAHEWSRLPSLPTARRGMGVTQGPCPGDTARPHTTCVYGLGGSPTAAATAVATVEVYVPRTNSWSALPSLPEARFGIGAAAAPCAEDLARTCVYAPGGAVGTAPSAQAVALDTTDTPLLAPQQAPRP
ncbi:Kelch repeat-containing protein [Streptomyces sp. NPDC006879]|uniref:Kelch repeat-containing protein n=1 Tax=Streptomyces sp. NPDC006879 TaxID=3364767 RepID=UPI0036B9E869